MESSKTRILVTGGTGYIGYRFLRELRTNYTQEFSPVAIARTPEKAILLDRLLDVPTSPSEPPVCIGDLLDLDSLRSAVRGVSIVVHLAADMDLFPSKPGRVSRVNVEGTRNLLQACAEESCRTGSRLRFVYISSTEAMGPLSAGEEVADETSILSPDCEYGRSKCIAEAAVKEYASQLDYVILRLSGVYGPGERYFFYEFISMVNHGLVIVAPGPLTGTICLAHIDDVIQGIILAIKRPEAVGQVYILTSEDNHSYREIVMTLARLLKRSPPIATMPLSLAKFIIALIAPIANFSRRRIFMFHPATIEKTVTRRVYSIAKIKRELGFHPKHRILPGVAETVNYELATGGIKRQSVSSVVSAAVTLVSLAVFGLTRLFLAHNHSHTPDRGSY